MLNNFMIYSCERLGLHSLAYLWERNQHDLLDEMVRMQTQAILIKVATMGKFYHL